MHYHSRMAREKHKENQIFMFFFFFIISIRATILGPVDGNSEHMRVMYSYKNFMHFIIVWRKLAAVALCK